MAQNPSADVVMVLPFENTSNRPEYNWVGESFADALAELLNKPGLIVVSSDERELAYQQLRLPETVIPSRATAIKLARQAKATMIVVGSYTVTPTKSAVVPGNSRINTVDMIAIQRHYLQLTVFTGCRLAAADCNGDGVVNTVDAIAIQQFFFAHPSVNIGKYRFNPASRSYSGITSDQTAQNYDTFIIGDVASPFVE